MDATTRRKLLKVFSHMRERCYDQADRRYKDWGGRGIKICQEWLDNPNNFIQWAENSGYLPGLTIDRVNNNGDYSPENCRWVSIAENNQNRRSTRFYTIDGETKNLQQWCETYSVSRSMVNKRLQMGWDIKSALTTPKRERDTSSIVGKKFGRLEVVRFSHIGKNRQSYYECLCSCGNSAIVNANKLITGHTRSCGCMQYEMRKNLGNNTHSKQPCDKT